MTEEEIAALLPPIPPDANKYTRGSLLVLAGSTRFPGAAMLAAWAAARTGAGYVTLAIPEPAAHIAQGHLLSIPVIAAASKDGAFAADAWAAIKGQLNHLDAIVLGPGLTITPSTSAFVQTVIQDRDPSIPLLIDADALNALASAYWEKIDPQTMILTPHAGELRRLLEATGLSSAEQLAQALNCAVVAKGPTTQIVSPTKCTSSSTGTAALAKAGTGDVLSGIIGALLVQGIQPFEAASLGVEIHSRAGQVAEQKLGLRSVCAEDVLEAIPDVLRKYSS